MGENEENERKYYNVCSTGDFETFKRMIETDVKNKLLTYAFVVDCLDVACKYGHLKIVEYLVSNYLVGKKAENFDRALKNACREKHMEIFEYLVSKGADNFNGCLKDACEDGRLEIAELMIKRGANYIGIGLDGACRGGYIKIVELLVNKGASYFHTSLIEACRHGHIEIVKFLMSEGSRDWDLCLENIENENTWNECLRAACRGGHLEIAKIMIDQGGITDWNECLRYILHYGYYSHGYHRCHPTIAILAIKQGVTDLDIDIIKKFENVWLYKMCCKNAGIDYRQNAEYYELFKWCPPYVLLSHRYKSKVGLNKLPDELFRLIFDCFEF